MASRDSDAEAQDWQLSCSELKQRGARLLTVGAPWADCAFSVGSERAGLCAHRLLLAMASPAFAAMLYGPLAEARGPVEVPDVQPDAFRAMLQYVYTDNVTITSYPLGVDLYYVAHKYMLPHLKGICVEYLLAQLSVQTACRGYEAGCLFDEQRLVDKALQIFQTQTKKVINDDSFRVASVGTVMKIFSSKLLNIDSELELFEAAERYALTTRDSDMPLAVAGPSSIEPSKPEELSVVEQVETKLNMSGQDTEAMDSDFDETQPASRTKRQVKAVILHRALKNIRFLTLTPQEFAEGPAKSSLLTKEESLNILLNILTNNTSVPMPDGFSTSRMLRNGAQEHEDEVAIILSFIRKTC